MKTVSFICLCIGLTCGMRLRKTKMPLELRSAMANVTSLETFLLAMTKNRTFVSNLRDTVRGLSNGEKKICGVGSRPKNCPQDDKDLCKNDTTCSTGFKCCNTGCRMECSLAPDDLGRSVLQQGLSDALPIILDSANCAPRPVAVEVSQPVDPNSLNFPLFVKLHRCGGACNGRPFETTCQVEETEDFNLLVSKVSWSSASDKLDELSQEIVSVRVTNHTKCGCLCEVKPADCDNRTQVHSSENCRCECKAQGATCPINFRWNPEKCQCVCDPTNIQHMCTKRYQFDDKKCGCACSSKSCKVKRKIRDPKDCRCKCPAKICLSEERYDLRTCTCVWRGERLRRTHRKRRLM